MQNDLRSPIDINAKLWQKNCVGWRRSWLRGSFATPTTLHGIPYTTLYVAPAASLMGTWIQSVTTSNVMSISSMAKMMSLSQLNVATMFSKKSLGLKWRWSTMKITSQLLLIDRRSLLGNLKKSGGEDTEWLIKTLVLLKLDQIKSPHKYFLSKLGIIKFSKIGRFYIYCYFRHFEVSQLAWCMIVIANLMR